MLVAARWVLVALLSAILIRLRFRRVPVFCLYVAAALLALATHIQLESWLGYSWLRWNEVLAGLRICAALEVLFLLTGGLERRARLSLMGFAICCGIVISAAAWHPSAEPDTLYYAFGALMRTAEAGEILGLMAASLLIWRVGVKIPQWAIRHRNLFVLLLANQIWPTLMRPATGALWRLENALYLTAACACAIGWISLGAPSSALGPPIGQLRAAHR